MRSTVHSRPDQGKPFLPPTKLSDCRRKRPVGCNSREPFSRIARPQSVTAHCCSALLIHQRNRNTTKNASTDPFYGISSPVAAWLGRKNVLINSPSPQTISSGNRLNHLRGGTSGCVSIHR